MFGFLVRIFPSCPERVPDESQGERNKAIVRTIVGNVLTQKDKDFAIQELTRN